MKGKSAIGFPFFISIFNFKLLSNPRSEEEHLRGFFVLTAFRTNAVKEKPVRVRLFGMHFRPILDRLGDVRHRDRTLPRLVRDRAGQLQYAVVRPGGQLELARCGPQ